MPDAAGAFRELCELSRQAATLDSVQQLLNWDQETYMPPAGGAFRADQQALLAALVHERRTAARVGELLAACEADRALTADPAGETAACLREMRRDYDRLVKLPAALVAEIARVGSRAQEVWKDARARSDFALFAPWLEQMFVLMRRKADCLGVPPGGEPYDALLDEYEPGARATQIDAVFSSLRVRLADLIADVSVGGSPPDTSVLGVRAEPTRQHELGLFVLRAIGFDLDAGRLDTTTHPFCSGLAPGDTRLTTRYRDERFTDALYGTLHEAGHGLYEQGLPKLSAQPGGHAGVSPVFGTPLAEAVSLGIHESQSRLWENFVGRSRAFWSWLFPHARRILAPALDAADADRIVRAVNTATPTFIRVEADEATYNFHVMLRFRLERALLNREIEARDVPGEWNRAFKHLLGLDVPDDRRGCLQDVHWSFGLVGYFPTYALGNLYAAQFWESARRAIPDLEDRIARGDFAPLRTWLNQNIHRHGRRFRAADLCRLVTGSDLSPDPLLRHLESRLRPAFAAGPAPAGARSAAR